MKKRLLWLASLILVLSACFNGDDSLFDDSDANDISVTAKMTLSLDSLKDLSQADTVHPEDTIVFLSEINPSKSIRMQRYFWTLDGEYFASEFNFRKNIPDPGKHQIALVLVDYFGDTLSDTLHLWVGNPPLLDKDQFIPGNESKSIPYQMPVSFVWNGYDPDSIYDIQYKFSLYDRLDSLIIDTLIGDNFYTYRHSLAPLSEYHWTVHAQNEIGMEAVDSLLGTFYTMGVDGEGGVQGKIKLSQLSKYSWISNLAIELKITGTRTIIDTLYINHSGETSFTLSPLLPGKYTVTAKAIDYSDYIPDTIDVEVRANQVSNVNALSLQDTLSPQITFASNPLADTLDFSDTLLFNYREKGGPGTIEIYLDNERIHYFSGAVDSIIKVILPESAKNLSPHILTFRTEDASDNLSTTDFFIRPYDFWFICNSDTTLYEGDSLEIFIEDRNPFGFEPDSFYFELSKNYRTTAIDASTGQFRSFTAVSYTFPDTVNTARTGIRYKNGVQKWRTWNIYRIFTRANEND